MICLRESCVPYCPPASVTITVQSVSLLRSIVALANSRGLPVVEDCAQAHGAVGPDGQLAGSWGTIAAFSTMSGKHHATGAQGGVVWCRDGELLHKARCFADRGKPLPLPNLANAGDGGSAVVSKGDGSGMASGFIPTGANGGGNTRMGLNLNSNELSAAIGRVQLRKLAAALESRRAIAATVAARLAVEGAGAVRPGTQQPGTYVAQCSHYTIPSVCIASTSLQYVHSGLKPRNMRGTIAVHGR